MLFSVALLLIALPLAPLRAQGAWQMESSEQRPSRSPAVTHRVLSVRCGEQTLEMQLVKFDRSRCTLRVVGLASGTTVADAARKNGGVAGVNGGYFKPGGVPLGLVMSGGEKIHAFETAKILSGVLVVTSRGASLLRAAEFKGETGVREALQAGPFLVDKGRFVAGLNAGRRAERTVLLADAEGVAALLTTSPVSLSELGQILATPDLLPGLKIERALNLDGGSSTALWVAADPVPTSRPEWKPVSNALIVAPAVK